MWISDRCFIMIFFIYYFRESFLFPLILLLSFMFYSFDSDYLLDSYIHFLIVRRYLNHLNLLLK